MNPDTSEVLITYHFLFSFPDRTIELETVLIEGCDHATIKRICKCRPFPSHLRGEVWPICLGVVDKRDSMVGFDEFFDMKEQAQLREDCQQLVGQCYIVSLCTLMGTAM